MNIEVYVKCKEKNRNNEVRQQTRRVNSDEDVLCMRVVLYMQTH